MRISRWGWSRYETEADLAAESACLSEILEVVPPRSDAEVLVVNSGTPVGAAILDQAPSAQLCITNTSGYEHLDLAELRARGVAAARLPMARRDAVVESTLWGMIHGLRRHCELLEGAAAGAWLRPGLPELGMKSLCGARVVIAGLGVIGRRMVEVTRMLGADVVGVDPHVRMDGLEQQTLEQAVAGADVLSLHCSLSAGNEGMVDASLLERAETGLVLINTARGRLVCWKDACAALRTRHLSALVLDVFPHEPWPELRSEPGMLLTPHSAGYHRGLCAALRDELFETVSCHLAGRALPHAVGE
jgi:phosphoglycerate dehydrogenase-like enzyme